MTLRGYVDTNIFLDYILDRKDRQGNPLMPEVEEFFMRIYTTDMEIIISEKVTEELYCTLKDISRGYMLFSMLTSQDKLIIVPYTAQDLEEATKLDPENRNDALHALLARKHGAQYLVTRNMKHFRKFSHIIEPKLPKEI